MSGLRDTAVIIGMPGSIESRFDALAVRLVGTLDRDD